MTTRFITIPPPILVPSLPRPYGIHDFLGEFVWCSPSWRQDEAGWAALERASKAFGEKSPGEVVALQDFDRVWNLILSAQMSGPHNILCIPFFKAFGSSSAEPPRAKTNGAKAKPAEIP